MRTYGIDDLDTAAMSGPLPPDIGDCSDCSAKTFPEDFEPCPECGAECGHAYCCRKRLSDEYCPASDCPCGGVLDKADEVV